MYQEIIFCFFRNLNRMEQTAIMQQFGMQYSFMFPIVEKREASILTMYLSIIMTKFIQIVAIDPIEIAYRRLQ